MPINVYAVHETLEENSPIIAVGTRKEVCHKLLLNEYWFYKILKNKEDILANQYYTEIYICNGSEEAEAKKKELLNNPKVPKEVRKKSAFEKQVETVEQMLKMHGNTIIWKNANRVIKRLEKDGYSVNVKHEPKRVIRSLLKPTAEVWDECWILELKKEKK